jgi:hypothetical protein
MPPITLDPGERQLAEYRPDRNRYWRDHTLIAVVLMAVAGGVVWATGTPHPEVGALGAVLAVAARAAYLASETLALRWILTDKRLIIPGNRSVPLMEIETIRPFMGDVQVITRAGDKHLLKHLADGPGVVARVSEARERRSKRRE